MIWKRSVPSRSHRGSPSARRAPEPACRPRARARWRRVVGSPPNKSRAAARRRCRAGASSSRSRASSRAARQEIRPKRRGCRPSVRFLVTDMVGTEIDFLVDRADPQRARGARANRDFDRRPSRRISPRSPDEAPVMILISVDLPAPFSPISAWISPGSTRKSTFSSALTAGVALGDAHHLDSCSQGIRQAGRPLLRDCSRAR